MKSRCIFTYQTNKMTNGNQSITNLIIETKGQLLKGQADVNGVSVGFYYHPKTDKFTASTLLNSEADMYGEVGKKRNWQYLILGSIAHAIKSITL